MAGFDYSLVDEAVNRIVEKFCPQKVIIFGSVAKKAADEFSDLDILVVMESDMEPFQRAVPIYLAVADIRIPKDIIVLTPGEFAENQENECSFVSEIVRTGIVAYEARSCRARRTSAQGIGEQNTRRPIG